MFSSCALNFSELRRIHLQINQIMRPPSSVKLSLWLLLLLLATFAYLAACSVEPHAAGEQPSGSARGRFQLPKLFDFEHYKKVYHKTYSTLTEALVRQQNVLSKAFRALISMVHYKRGTRSHFLAVNHLSDKTREELARMKNPKAAGELRNLTVVGEELRARSAAETLDVFPGDDVEGTLDRIAEEYSDDDDVVKLQAELKHSKATNKRARRESNVLRRRQINLDRLINTGESGKKMAPEALAKARSSSAYANPDHIQPELMSEGLRDARRVKFVQLTSKHRQEAQQVSYTLTRLFNGLGSFWTAAPQKDDEEVAKSKEPLDDEVFVDHRDSNCMWTPRNQGDCGSCYAFAWTALAEWLHCKATGELLAFSEQYIVDCGRYTKADGCDGGSATDASSFIHNFGVELRKNYPYMEVENECPYDEDADLKTTGYIRMNLRKLLTVPMSRWDEFLPLAPLYVAISTEGAFHEYGGGVYDGAGCVFEGEHAVVLIGHGREDGQEYWLIRNSHSVAWGEGGYMKLAKDTKCIEPEIGTPIGFDAEKSRTQPVFEPKVLKNKRHNIAKIKTRYAEGHLGE